MDYGLFWWTRKNKEQKISVSTFLHCNLDFEAIDWAENMEKNVEITGVRLTEKWEKSELKENSDYRSETKARAGRQHSPIA